MALPSTASLTSLIEKDLRLMRIFRAVAESGGLTAAETKLNMERSTISRHVKAIEGRLGGPLCVRGPGGFELTDLGHVVLRASIMACDTLDRVRDELNLARGVITGDLHVGLPDNCITNPQAGIAAAIAAFRKSAPNVKLHVHIRPPHELVEELCGRRLHLSVVGGDLRDSKLEYDSLFEEEFRLYTGRCKTVAPRIGDLDRLSYGLVGRRTSRRTADLASALGIPVTAEAFGLEAVATLLASGSFVGFLPTHFAESLGGSHGIREVQGADAFSYSAHFHLAREKHRPLSAQGELFRHLIQKEHSELQTPPDHRRRRSRRN
jgi:LysR family transcriptional regulator, transcriptional activator for bauABCD operon